MADYAWLIPLLPLLASAGIGMGYIAGWNRGEAGERFTAGLASSAAALALLLLLGIDAIALLQGVPGQVSHGVWLHSGDYVVQLSFNLDALGLSLATLAALISLLTLRFSVNYLHREAGFQRFFMLLSLFMSAMLLIVLAGNALFTFIGWELAGVSSYLLIAFALDRPAATLNAGRAFITNRIGDAGFIVALSLSLFWLNSVEWPAILGCTSNLDMLRIGLIVASFLLPALVKSAQVPFTPWITRALDGPTPSSAVFYGALMVHAGVYLVIRLEPLLQQVPVLMMTLVLLGGATALYGFLASLVQTDVKSALMFATIGQTGLMFLACGLGWFTFAAWHLAAHASWRAYQFLSAPALMHLTDSRPSRPVPGWLQRRKWLYTATLQRFWLDNLADWLLARPTRMLAQDMQAFDQQVVNRLVGLPGSASAVSSLAQWEAFRHGRTGRVVGDSGDVGHGRGAIGRLLETVAGLLHWFEEHLVLKGGDVGIFNLVQRLGTVLVKIEVLLSEPRYLILLIVITFIVIL
jgi:NADH:ubiquinone oxidoreductase subunit 5 (subunit L)/multisubunit Na+/H+ antiporter MnhA subunit